MRIEFFYKETGNVVSDPSSLSVDHEGDVFEITFEYEDTYINYQARIGWRVIDT